jgi:hypothetical protein
MSSKKGHKVQSAVAPPKIKVPVDVAKASQPVAAKAPPTEQQEQEVNANNVLHLALAVNFTYI